MVELGIFKHKQPWRDALIASTGLSVFVLAASRLWSFGHHEWAFVLVFTATWLLLSISWSNIDFTEKSGAILAGVMDHNFHKMHEQIEQMEKDLAEVRAILSLRGGGFNTGVETDSQQTAGFTHSFGVLSGDD